MEGAAIQDQQDQQNAEMNGSVQGEQGNPEMSTRPTHVRQTLPNGEVGWVRQDGTKGASGTGRKNDRSGEQSLSHAGAQDDGAISSPHRHKNM